MKIFTLPKIRPRINPARMKEVVEIRGQILMRRRIRDLAVGESGYTVPWACDKYLMLNGEFSVHESPRGTASMRVERLADGYRIDIPEDYQW